MDVSGKATDRMNQNPEVASFWKGRILIQCTCEETEKPKLLVRKLQNKDIEDAKSCLVNKAYSCRIYVNQVICIPEKDEKYKVEVAVGD